MRPKSVQTKQTQNNVNEAKTVENIKHEPAPSELVL